MLSTRSCCCLRPDEEKEISVSNNHKLRLITDRIEQRRHQNRQSPVQHPDRRQGKDTEALQSRSIYIALRSSTKAARRESDTLFTSSRRQRANLVDEGSVAGIRTAFDVQIDSTIV